MPDYRVYWNRRAERPTVWAIDEGDQTSEINVASFLLHNVSADSHWNPDVPANPDTPSAWITIIHATMKMVGGVAHFWHDDAWRVHRFNLAQLTPEQKEDAAEAEVQRRLSELP